LKFRFQINGEIDYLSDTTPRTVVDWLSDHIKDESIKLTGITVFEMAASRKRGKTKLLQ